MMSLIIGLIQILVIILFIRLLVRPNEAYFNPLYHLVYRITDPVLRPSRYLTTTPTQGVLFTILALTLLRGLLYPAVGGLDFLGGIGRSFLDLFDLLFQVYMVILIVTAISRMPYGSFVMTLGSRAFVPIYNALLRIGIGRQHFPISSFFFLLILHIIASYLSNALIYPPLLGKPAFLIQIGGRTLILIIGLYRFFTIVIIVGALMSWVSPDPRNPIVEAIYSLSEPILAPFRRVVPSLGGIDISPIFAIIALQLAGAWVTRIISSIAESTLRSLGA